MSLLVASYAWRDDVLGSRADRWPLLCSVAVVLEALDESILCKVRDVVVSDNHKGSPTFTSEEGWLEDTCKIIMAKCAEWDGAERVAPMALVRCSRGGKTRALLEIAHALKDKVSHMSYII
jgi:hypothetical protein